MSAQVTIYSQPREVGAIPIFAHEEVVTKPSWDDHKFKPVNKETADHSFYYCAAVGRVAGDCSSAQCNNRWLHDADVARLMALCILEAKPELTALFKQGTGVKPCPIT